MNNAFGGFQPLIDRPVMSLELDKQTGEFVFRLYDQLDHVEDSAVAENTVLATKVGGVAGTLNNLDFGKIIKATDGDGDSISLDGKLVITIKDDVPEVSITNTGAMVVHDETADSQGTETTSVSGIFSSLGTAMGYARADVIDYSSTPGADEPLTRVVSLELNVGEGNPADGLASGLFTTSGSPITLFVEGNLIVGRDGSGNVALAVSIDPQGRVSIAQYQPLKHGDPDATNEPLDLTGKINAVVTVTDNDGDVATDRIDIGANIQFLDDAPVAGGTVALTVAENDIANRLSIGSDPFNQDEGEDSRSLLSLLGVGFASTVSDELLTKVSFGADGAAAGGGFSFTSDAISTLNGMGLLSKGSPVVFTIINGAIVGYVNNAFGGFQPLIDRPVMSLELDKQTGEFVFRLYDQLDHVGDSAVAENTVLATKVGGVAGPLDNLDFGKIIKATDGDGDSISLDGKLVITIKDDVPELTGKTEARTVDEDDIRTSQSLGTSPADYDADGSWTGGPGQGGNGGAFIDGSLAYLVKGGADDAVKFSFSDDAASVLQGLGLKSKGDLLSYEVKGNILYAYDNNDGTAGYGAGDRVVFKLTLNSNGSYSFELIDQLDHVKPDAGADENFPLQPSGLLAINFGSVIEAKDFDGDSIKLGNAFSIEVRDDVPVHTGEVEKISLDAPELVETTVGKVANFVLVLDTSGSVTLSQIQSQVTQFLNSLANSGAEDVRVHIVRFAGDAAPVGTFDLIQDGAIVASQLTSALTAIGQLPSGGATNYEAGLQQALQWIEGAPSQTISVNTTISSFDANTNGPFQGNGNNDTAHIIGNGTTQIALVSGWRDPGTNTGHLEDAVGNTTDGWGVVDGDVDRGEILRFDFGAFNDFDGANGAYANVGNFSGVPVVSATFKLDRESDNSPIFRYTVHFVDGTSETFTRTVSNNDTSITVGGSGKEIAYVEFMIVDNGRSSGYGDVDLQSVVTAPIAPGTLEDADVNQLIFLSDGQPNATQSGSANATNALQAIIDEITRIESDTDGPGRDQKFTIEAFGVGANASGLGNLGKVEGPEGSSDNVSSGSTLTSAMQPVLDSLVETTVTGQSVSGTFDVKDLVAVGADDDITFSLGTNTSGLPQQLGGMGLIYSFEAGLLVAKSGGATVFTLALSPDGKGTFTLYKPLGQSDVNIDFSSIVRATDFDGDSIALATGKFVVTVVAPNVAPTDIALSAATVAENAAGAVIGTLTTTDPNAGNTHTYTVSDNRFEVVGNQLKLQTGVSLNYEAEPTVNVTVMTKDGGNLSYSETFAITVTNVNEKPTEITLSASTVAENAAGAVIGTLATTDPDAGDMHSYTVDDDRFEVVGGQLKLKDGVSLDHEVAASVNVTVTTTDVGGLSHDQTFAITVTNVNEKPTEITLSASTVAENAAGAVIGALATMDPDAGDTHSYTVDDDRFEVLGGQLKLKDGVSLDHEVAASVNVTVTTTDAGGLSHDQTFAITVTNVNEKPTEITLSASTVAENAAGAVIGTLATTDPDAGDTHSYTVDDDRFEVLSGQLKLKDGVSLDHEAAASVNVKVTTTDAGGLSHDQTFAITVTNVNEKPTEITLSASTVAENAAGAVIGALATTDPDAGDTHSYTVDDDRFEVVGGQLKLKDGVSLDYEAAASVNVKVTTTDAGGLSHEQTFAITVTDVNEVVAQDPTGQDKTVNLVEDVTYTFKTSDFGYQDADGHTFAGVTVTPPTGTSAGKLMLGNVLISGTQFVTAEQIAAGMLTWAPADNVVGSNGSTLFTFKVKDSSGAEDSDANAVRLQMSTTNFSDFNETANVTLGVGAGFANASVSQTTSGTERITFGDTNAAGNAFSGLNFQRSDNNLEITVTTEGVTRVITVLDQYAGGNSVWEQVRFDEGVFAGYDFSGRTYALSTGLNGGNGNSDDIVAGSAAADLINGGNGRDLLFGNGGNDTINGESGNDLIFGGLGNDTIDGGQDDDVIVGGAGNDVLTGGSGRDRFVWGDELLSGDNADRITDYRAQDDIIDLSRLLPANTSSVNYIKLVRDGNDLLVKVDLDGNGNASAPELAYRLVGGNDLASVVINYGGSNKNFTRPSGGWVAAADPIILDLDKNGFAFSPIGDGVTFDINADGKADQIAWTSDDGILAYDVDGNGLIDNGSEIFTPDFNGGKFASGVAALASLDTNGDGKIDANDDAFSKLQIWVDADNDGVSDEGELSNLFDNGVTSISLTTDNTGGQEDGQTVFSTGTFTFADGSTGDFMEVGFDTIFGSDADPLTVMGTDGDDILHGGMGQVVMTGGAGADTFVFDATALDELDVADVITDFNSDEGDVLDVTALLDSLLGEQATAETAASHLRTTVEDGNTTVSVQTGVDTWKDVVVLHNHDTAVKVLFDDKHSVTVTHD
ncbi:MAG: DUF5801 repeats-in-toxin domain-containing protein [Rhizobium rhizophilum]|uniref:DUF5801 repeats-in-toxin domain-containing protein n=1 Tax=Rhizobium rhizophilum TaxID=1850373 RepID=UPI00391941E1